ncbi:nodulation protein NfeD [Candidatus Poribacteria bacterium]|nr:nodulation protein NfeD [Candidatus Poribacteria bacterium]MYH83681.1 nodulation protein NfeD [Candidatus Poribacteria bacterium]MYK95525.1 nodulation protein NfeD [Candidatus Poribacteria bacterium]
MELAIQTTSEGNFMRRKTHLLGYVLLLIGCHFLSSNVLAQDTALVYVIDIRNEIGSGLGTYISEGIQIAEEARADAIVFDVDTPGGRVDSAVNIIRAIQETQIPTIAFVNRQAISAGAMISIACNQIVMTSGGTIGDSAPVNVQGQEVGEKAISYIQGTIRATAERENRNPDIAEAMVDKELVLVKLKDGQIVKLLPEEYATRQEEGEEMEILCAQGKLLTLSTRQALEYGFADAQAETLTELLAQYEIVDVAGTKMPLTEEDIMQRQREYGVSQVNRLKTLSDARVTEVRTTLADRVVFFLTNPFISSLLLSLGLLGIFIEIRSPGFGVPGFLGLLCVGLFFGGHMLLKIGAEWALLLFLIGVGLIVLEIFVIPGFGVAGILGIIMMLGSVFFVFDQVHEFSTAVLWLSISVILTSALVILAAFFLPETRLFQRFALSTVMDTEMGYHSSSTEDFQAYLGQSGTALTPLRPSGTARIGDKRVDVVTVGDFISQNSSVKVVEVEGPKVFVEAVEDD